MDVLYLILAVVIGSAISLAGGALLFTTKKRRTQAILLAMPFGAGALLAAAFFDLLPEAFTMAEPRELLLWTLGGFTAFFLLERLAGWFHQHHDYRDASAQHGSQRKLIIFGDFIHNAIDGLAIGAAFLVSPITGIVTTLAVSAHEIPKELGTFALLLSRGWKDKTVIFANIMTAVATLVTALLVFTLGAGDHLPVAQLLAVTAGFFLYIAASDIVPDIHKQPRKQGTIQAIMLVAGIVIVGGLITSLHDSGAHTHDHAVEAQAHQLDDDHDH